MGEDGLMAQSNSRPGDPEQGETEQRDQSNSRAVAGVPTWALAILGAGGLAIAAGFIGYWSGNRGPALVAPVSYAGTSNSPTASATLTPGPDGLYPTPTPASTYPGVETTSGAQTATSQTETQGSLGRTTTTPGRTSKTAGVEAFNPATVTPLTPIPQATPSRTKSSSTPQSSKTTTKATSPVASATTEKSTTKPSSSQPSTPAADEVKVSGPPSGLTVTTDDLSFGQCPSKFRTYVEVQVEYGTSSSAKAKWKASETGASGSASLPMKGYNTFAGTISGIPTKTPVVLTVVVTGPDGTATNDPFEITHRC